MSGDKRSVATDALETLGMIIDKAQKRDAIHLAVEPIEAGEKLWPGQDVGMHDGKAWRTYSASDTPHMALGIVDPFLKAAVQPGERFWLVVYPRQIHSLRHVWTHPAFPDAPELRDIGLQSLNAGIDRQLAEDEAKRASEKWLRDWCASADCPGFDLTIAAATGEKMPDVEDYGPAYCIVDDYLVFNGRDAHGEIPPEFWHHVERYTGKKCPSRPAHFSCSC